MLKNERGEGIISGLVAAAILGVVVLIVATLYDLASNSMIKSATIREVDTLQKRITGLLKQKTHCEAAIVPLNWDGISASTVPVIRQPEAGDEITPGMPINNGRLFIDRIILRPPDWNRNDVVDDPNPPVTTVIDGVNFETYVGEILITFRRPTGVRDPVGEVRPRSISVLMTINPSTNQVQFCDLNDEATIVEGGPIHPINPNCTIDQALADGDTAANCSPTFPGECTVYAYAERIDASGEPRCRCKNVCAKPVWTEYESTGRCVAASASRSCPPGAEGPTPPNPYIECRGRVGHYCYIPVDNASCGSGNMVYSMVCK